MKDCYSRPCVLRETGLGDVNGKGGGSYKTNDGQDVQTGPRGSTDPWVDRGLHGKAGGTTL